MSFRKLDQKQVDQLPERFESAEGRLDAAEGRLDGHDSDIAQEVADRQAGDTTLTNSLNAEVARATAAEGVLTTNLNQEIADRVADVNAEETRALAAEAQLQSNLDNVESAAQGDRTAIRGELAQEISDLVGGASPDYDTLKELEDAIKAEEGRIDTLLAGSSVDFDTLIEIVNAYQLADTNIISSITSLQAAHDQEVLDRAAGDLAEQQRAEGEEARIEGKVDTEKSRAEGEEARIEGKFDAEVVRLDGVDASLAADITAANNNVDAKFGSIESATEYFSKSDFSDEGGVFLKSPPMLPPVQGQRVYMSTITVNGVVMVESGGWTPADPQWGHGDVAFYEDGGSWYVALKHDYLAMEFDVCLKKLTGPM